MQCLHCAWSISSLFIILNHRVIYLSYIPHPQHLYKSSDVVLRSRRRCVILGESKLQLIWVYSKTQLFGFCSRSKPRKSALVLKRNMIALSIVLTARFGHLKHVHKCHRLNGWFLSPFQFRSSVLKSQHRSHTCPDRLGENRRGWESVSAVSLGQCCSPCFLSARVMCSSSPKERKVGGKLCVFTPVIIRHPCHTDLPYIRATEHGMEYV